jgi:membrane protease YdiL (CAAX protease family)
MSRRGGPLVIPDPPAPNRTADALLVALAMTLPTVMAWLYLLALGGTGRLNTLQQAGYAAGKILQFSIPILFLLFVARRWPRVMGVSTDGLLLGLGFGVLVAGAIVAAYYALRSSSLLAGAGGRVRAKMEEFGVASPAGFLTLALFLCAAHSFLEEYYWRWYVFGRLRTMLPLATAVLVSSVGFMAHHVLILYAYLPDKLLTGVLPASLGVAVGGAVWAWLYDRTGSLVAPWLSHAIVDAALFVVGWDMMRQAA